LREAGAIVVMATHDFETAEGLVDRPFCLAEGRARTMVEAGGTLRERHRRTMAEGRA
jgi:ABC-type Mn2+/Zn2+ transport system ATPase subunit